MMKNFGCYESLFRTNIIKFPGKETLRLWAKRMYTTYIPSFLFDFTVAFNVAISNVYYMIIRNSAHSYNIIQAIKDTLKFW